MKENWERMCNRCGKKLTYKTKRGFDMGNEKNSNCLSCSLVGKNRKSEDEKKRYVRLCPTCSMEIKYRIKMLCVKAENKNSQCRKCELKNRYGNKNPFYGRHHTDETKKKYTEWRKNPLNSAVYKTEAFRKKQSELNSGKNNFFYGKSVHDIFVKKYGKTIADKKWEDFKENLSKKNSGKGNPMYGKPSPMGSGNGWSGWYKGWYFRSLHELAYMVYVIERFGLKWYSAEKKMYKIPYINYDGTPRSYFADFLINDKYIVECKPKALWKTPLVSTKRKAAESFCKALGLKYKIVDVGKPSNADVLRLYKTGDIKFLERYEKKFLERYKTK